MLFALSALEVGCLSLSIYESILSINESVYLHDYMAKKNKIKIKDLNDVKIDVGPLAQLPSPPTLRTPTLKLARVKPRLT